MRMWVLMSSDVGVDIIIRDNKPYEGDFSKWHVVQIVFKGLALPLNPCPGQFSKVRARPVSIKVIGVSQITTYSDFTSYTETSK